MPIRDEKTFTDDEFIAAFSFIMPPERAREEAAAWNDFPDPKGFEDATYAEIEASGWHGPRSYDGDLLDLLSLVSESCAERAWKLLGISREEGELRRDGFRLRVEEAHRSANES